MAHGVKKILIDKKDEIECNNNQQSVNNINKMALNSLLLDNCCLSPSNQNLINQKNSSTNTNALVATHQLLPPTQHSTLSLMNNSNGNKLSLNCSGASLSTIASSATKSPTTGTKMGSRRIFTPQFKLQVLESYRNDNDCKGNQRATARKYGIHRRQIQKWLQCENNLRSIIANNPQNVKTNAIKSIQKATAPILSSSSSNSRHRGVVGANTDKNGATYSCFTLTNAKSYKSNNVGSSTKSLTSSSLAFTDYSMGSNATASEMNRNHATNISISINNSFYYDNSRLLNLNVFNTEKSEELPIDLSCNNKIKLETVARPIALHPSLADYKHPFYHFNSPSSASASPQLIDISNSVVKTELRNDPIDLSIPPNVSYKRKLSTDSVEKADKKPIKLFRPYLEGNFDGGDKVVKQEDVQTFPVVWSNNAYNFYPEHFTPAEYHAAANHPFLVGSPTFFDTQLAIPVTPSSTALSSPNDSGIMNSSFQTLMPPSQASPVSGYDSSTSSIYSFNDNEADISQGNSPHYTSSHYDVPSPLCATMSPTETKVPLFSSSFLHDLKFKLHALDCYYNDAECKRSEKLVANKLNINSKVVEKWLRQEKDLRHQQKQYHLDILV